MCQYETGGVCSLSGSSCTSPSNAVGRCQLSSARTRKTNARSLLLSLPDQETDELVRRALLSTGFHFARLGSLIIIADAHRRLSELNTCLSGKLSEDHRTSIRAAFAPAEVNSYEQALFSFAAAEPLDQLLEKSGGHCAVNGASAPTQTTI